jgi:hypothetical protein
MEGPAQSRKKKGATIHWIGEGRQTINGRGPKINNGRAPNKQQRGAPNNNVAGHTLNNLKLNNGRAPNKPHRGPKTNNVAGHTLNNLKINRTTRTKIHKSDCLPETRSEPRVTGSRGHGVTGSRGHASHTQVIARIGARTNSYASRFGCWIRVSTR